MITKQQFESGYTYEEYRKLVDEKLAKGETTGIQTPEKVEASKMNVHRMNRWDKSTKLSEELSAKLAELQCEVNWLLLAEGWCADASQNLPILNKMAEASPNVNLRILLRDEHLDIMDQYLTNGGRAIPKLVVLDDEMSEVGTWGPRPTPIQQMVREGKESGQLDSEQIGIMVQKWYAKDKGETLEREMMQVIENLDCVLDEQP